MNKLKLIINSKIRNKNINKNIKIIKLNNFLYNKNFIKKYNNSNFFKFLKIKHLKKFNLYNK